MLGCDITQEGTSQKQVARPMTGSESDSVTVYVMLSYHKLQIHQNRSWYANVMLSEKHTGFVGSVVLIY